MERTSSAPGQLRARQLIKTGFTHRDERVPDPCTARGAIGSAVEQVNSFAEDTLGEDDRGGNVLEGKHLERLVMGKDVRGDLVSRVGCWSLDSRNLDGEETRILCTYLAAEILKGGLLSPP